MILFYIIQGAVV